MRPYLAWISTASKGPASDLMSANRQYDVFVHNYETFLTPITKEAEYSMLQRGEKLNVAAAYGEIFEKYRAVAFLDDDLSFTPDSLNRAFLAGDMLGLDIWQPSLAKGSFGSHPHLYQREYYSPDPSLPALPQLFHRGVRPVAFVEIMMPFFSQAALREALPTFDINESGWGLDIYMWPKIAPGHVLDGVSFGHYREPGRRDRILKNGLTCWQELWIQKRIHDPRPENFFPPGYSRPNIESVLAE